MITKFRLLTCKQLDTICVRYIETGGWEVTDPDGKKELFRKASNACRSIRRFDTAKGAREWMARAKANPVSFDEFIPFYAEIIRIRGGKWYILNKTKTWENFGTRAVIRRALRWCTDLNPKETKRVLDYVERRDKARP